MHLWKVVTSNLETSLSILNNDINNSLVFIMRIFIYTHTFFHIGKIFFATTYNLKYKFHKHFGVVLTVLVINLIRLQL